MNIEAVREAVSDYVHHMSGRHVDLTENFARLGLPDEDQGGSKAERLQRSAAQLHDGDLTQLAARILEQGGPHPGIRNRLEDLLAEDLPPGPELTLRTRRELARALPIDELFVDADGFLRLLETLWVLDNPDETIDRWPFGPSVRDGVEQHVLRNDDWDTETLFSRIGALHSHPRRFARFLEGLSSSDVLPDVDRQRRFVGLVNHALRMVGVELQENDVVDGYPAFILTGRGQNSRTPKQVIFAAVGRKPDLRFSDALDNQVEILDGQDRVLAYSRPLGPEGLTWAAVQAWWSAENNQPDDNAAKDALYKRLVAALPKESPPQYRFFTAYHRVFAPSIRDLPALLPEVWYCWDPKSLTVRGTNALPRSRVDFMLLLPGPTRVVVEVDGPHHYVDDQGRPARSTYAADVASDRAMTLTGYQVFRFSTDELSVERADNTVEEFFRALYLPHRLLDSAGTGPRSGGRP